MDQILEPKDLGAKLFEGDCCSLLLLLLKLFSLSVSMLEANILEQRPQVEFSNDDVRSWLTHRFEHLLAKADLVVQLSYEVLARASICFTHAPQVQLVAFELLISSLRLRPLDFIVIIGRLVHGSVNHKRRLVVVCTGRTLDQRRQEAKIAG